MLCSIENNQMVNQDFEFDCVKYQSHVKQEDDLLLHDTQ